MLIRTIFFPLTEILQGKDGDMLVWLWFSQTTCVVLYIRSLAKHAPFPVLLVKHTATEAKRENMARDDYYCSTSYGWSKNRCELHIFLNPPPRICIASRHI